VVITIYNTGGQTVQTLDLGHQAAGVYRSKSHSAYWNGRNRLGEQAASGVYYYVLSANDFRATGKMLLLK
jgi:flagellar hook assembly protein FlgD